MIGADVVYLRPSTVGEAVAAWAEQASAGDNGSKVVRYLGGGTEIVTSARRAAHSPHALVDVARLEELRRLGPLGGRLVFGAALCLNDVGDSGLFPLLSATVRHIADRTTRNRLSLGGNVAGALPYREALLPLLLADALMVTAAPVDGGPPRRRERSLRSVFDKRLLLEPGELVVEFSIAPEAAAAPWYHQRATRTGPVDYPLVTACFAAGGALAVSGLLAHPAWFADPGSAHAAFADHPVKHDQRGSAEYRLALFEAMARRAQEALQ